MRVSSSVAIEVFRARYHVEVVPADYDGRRHAAFNALVAAAPVLLALQVLAANWDLAWGWIVPAVVLLASAVEFAFHGSRRVEPVEFNVAPQRGKSNHHRYFSSSAMSIESWRDLHAVLTPTWRAVLLEVGLLVTAGGVAEATGSWAAAALFLFAASGYLLVHEALHVLSHLPRACAARRVPVLNALAARHRLHHDHSQPPSQYSSLLPPLCDWSAAMLRPRRSGRKY